MSLLGDYLNLDMFGQTAGGLTKRLADPGVRNTVVVPIPVAQQPTQVKQSASVKQSTSRTNPNQTSASVAPTYPTQPTVDFGPTPTYNQDRVPSMPEQPLWHENLGQYLGGKTLTQAVQPPTYQGFGLPVFSDAQAFAMSPEQYEKILDTTKNNIAFNNKVAGDNFYNTLNIIKLLSSEDQANQEQFSRSLANRSNVIQGNINQKQSAFLQSPQEQAAMNFKGQVAQTDYSAKLQEVIHRKLAIEEDERQLKMRKEMAAIEYKYASALKGQDTKNLGAALRGEIQKKVIDIYGDVYKTAVKGFTQAELDRLQGSMAKGDENAFLALLKDNPNITPLSESHLKGAYNAQQIINQATGGALGNIFSEITPREEKKVISSKEELFSMK